MNNNKIDEFNINVACFNEHLNEIKNLSTEATNKIHVLLPKILNNARSSPISIDTEIKEVQISNDEKDILIKLLFKFNNISSSYAKKEVKDVLLNLPLQEQDSLLALIWPFINDYPNDMEFNKLLKLIKDIPVEQRGEVCKSLFSIFVRLKGMGYTPAFFHEFAKNYIDIDSCQRSDFEKLLLPLLLDSDAKEETRTGWEDVLRTLARNPIENRLKLLAAYGPILKDKVFDRTLRVVFEYLIQIPPSKYSELYRLSTRELKELEKDPSKDLYKLRCMVSLGSLPEGEWEGGVTSIANILTYLPNDRLSYEKFNSTICKFPANDRLEALKALSAIVDRFKIEKNFSQDLKDLIFIISYNLGRKNKIEFIVSLTPELNNLNSFIHFLSCKTIADKLNQEDIKPAMKALALFCQNFPIDENFDSDVRSSSHFLETINFLNSKQCSIVSTNTSMSVAMLNGLQLFPAAEHEKVYVPFLELVRDYSPFMTSLEIKSNMFKLIMNTRTEHHENVLKALRDVFNLLESTDVTPFVGAMAYLSPDDYEKAIKDYLDIKQKGEHALDSSDDILFALFDSNPMLLESTQKYLYDQLESFPSREAAKDISDFVIHNFPILQLADESPLLFKAFSVSSTIEDVANPKDPYLLFDSLTKKIQEQTPEVDLSDETIIVMSVQEKEPEQEDKEVQVIIEKIPAMELLENINKQKLKETVDGEINRLSEVFKEYTLEDQVPALLSAILEARQEMANTPVTFLNQLPIMEKFKGEQRKYNIIMNAIENIPENEQILLAGTKTDIENLLYKLVKDDKTSQKDLLEKMMSAEVLTVSDKDKFYKFLIRVDRQAITKFPYSNDPELLKYMAYKLAQQKCPESIERGVKLRLMHKELVREVNHYLAESECDFQIDGSKVKMIADFNTLDLASLKSILRSEMETAYQALKDDEDQASIETANLRLNPKTFQERLHEPHFYARQLPKDVNTKTLGDLFHQLEERLQSLDVADREKIEQEISEGSGELSLSQLKENLINDPNVNTYYVDSEQSDQEISLNTLRFYAAIKFVVDQNNDVISKNSLTVRESMLLKMSTSIQACSAGKSEGLALYYNILPQQYRIQEESEVASVSESSNDIPEVVRGKRYLDGVIQSTLDNFMADNVSFMKELINQNNDVEIPQGAHQTIYVKNLISARVGHYHRLKFDPYSKLINDHLFNLSLEDVLKTYYKHFKPSLLMEQLKNTIKRDIGKEATLYNDLSRTIAESGRSYREDLVWKISEEEGEQPFELTTYGAMQILIAAGYLSEEES